jgi:hypothetical protein
MRVFDSWESVGLLRTAGIFRWNIWLDGRQRSEQAG